MFNEKFEKCLITFLPVRLITLKNMYEAGPNDLTLGIRDTAILKAFLGYFGPTDTTIKFSIRLLKVLI